MNNLNRGSTRTEDVDALISELEVDYVKLLSFSAGATRDGASPTHPFDQSLTYFSCCQTQ